MARTAFEKSLEELNSDLLKMGNKAKNALIKSVTALEEKNLDQSVKVMDKDYKINELEEDINNEVVWLIAKEQPVATDLRRLMVILKISNDLERVGDLAVNIAKSNIRIGQKELFKPLEDIPLMANKVIIMLDEVMEAFQKEDVTNAREIAEKDDEIDYLHGKLIEELLHYMSEDPTLINQITQLAFVCRDLERVGDHVTNISENIVYLVKGRKLDLNN